MAGAAKKGINGLSQVDVVHISGSGDVLGGAEKCLSELLEKEVKSNIGCALIAPDEGKLTEYARGLGVPVKVISYSPWVRWVNENPLVLAAKTAVKAFRNVPAESKLKSYFRELAPSVIHINTSTISSGFFAARSLGIPIVWHIRELCDKESGRVFYIPEKQRTIIASSDKVIAVSRTVAKAFSPYTQAENICTIYDSVRPPDSLERFDLFTKSPVIAIIGSVVPAKGQMEAFQALAELAQEDITFKVIVAGDCPDEEYQNKLVRIIEKTGMQGRFAFLGRVSEPYETLFSSDICLNCSRSESFGRVTVESMLSGCLTIGKDTTGTTELLSNGRGLLYNTTYELVENLFWALNNANDARQIAATGKAYAWDCFADVDGSYKKIEEVFKDAVR